MTNPYDLNRFVAAQAGTYADALAELRAGAKLRSSLALFLAADAGAPLDGALAMFFGGKREPPRCTCSGRELRPALAGIGWAERR